MCGATDTEGSFWSWLVTVRARRPRRFLISQPSPLRTGQIYECTFPFGDVVRLMPSLCCLACLLSVAFILSSLHFPLSSTHRQSDHLLHTRHVYFPRIDIASGQTVGPRVRRCVPAAPTVRSARPSPRLPARPSRAEEPSTQRALRVRMRRMYRMTSGISRGSAVRRAASSLSATPPRSPRTELRA